MRGTDLFTSCMLRNRLELNDRFNQSCGTFGCRAPFECPTVIADLITSCMKSNPADRPTAKEVVISLSQPEASGERSRATRAAPAAEGAENKVMISFVVICTHMRTPARTHASE